jgi:hypothetical protein
VAKLEARACECYRVVKNHLDNYTEFDSGSTSTTSANFVTNLVRPLSLQPEVAETTVCGGNVVIKAATLLFNDEACFAELVSVFAKEKEVAHDGQCVYDEIKSCWRGGGVHEAAPVW